MGGRLRILACLLVGAVSLLGAGPALAQGGTTTSAGDQQYIDPLANTNPAPSPSAPAPASTSTTSSAPASPTPAAAPAQPAVPAATPATTTTSADPGGTLPYTGLNLGLILAVGVGLLVAGLVLRRVARPSGAPRR